MLDCSKPVGPGPRRSPICSIDPPTSAARNARAQAETMKRATSGALAAAMLPDAAVKMPAPAIARRCEVPRASVVLGMSSTCADVTATSASTLYSEFPASPGRRGRVVQARACKALYSGSIPLAASNVRAGQRRYRFGACKLGANRYVEPTMTLP